ncbi:MAG: hypothetical protein JW981_07280 [Anaerolineae bacterium]|nr:hypothetical protein [Anaerolineae bacterium]
MQRTGIQTGELAAYTGVVREGRIQLVETVTLPEGSMVYVLVPVAVDVNAARRKANRWLLENVGNMLRADHPLFVRLPNQTIWRFGAFVTASSHKPIGPVGYIDVDTVSGEVLADDQTAEEIATRGERLECIPLPADN